MRGRGRVSPNVSSSQGIAAAKVMQMPTARTARATRPRRGPRRTTRSTPETQVITRAEESDRPAAEPIARGAGERRDEGVGEATAAKSSPIVVAEVPRLPVEVEGDDEVDQSEEGGADDRDGGGQRGAGAAAATENADLALDFGSPAAGAARGRTKKPTTKIDGRDPR